MKDFMPGMECIRWPMFVILLLMLVGCGGVGAETHSSQQSGHGSLATATLTSLQDASTQQTIAQTMEIRMENEQKTALVLPTAGPHDPSVPATPGGLETGWLTDCADFLSPKDFGNFAIANCYRTKQVDRYTTVFSGGLIDIPLQGKILVFTKTLDLRHSHRIVYLTPQPVGSVALQTIDYPLATFEFTNGTGFIFNLETRQWLDMNGTPIPTATPIGQ
jgi:hypothetical protein